MNTNKLKSFAQNTRLRLLKEVSNKLNYVLNSDSLTLRDYAASIDKLKKDIDTLGTDALIDKVAYTWFNRLMALRFMDANGFQPLQLSVISPVEGYTQPEILNEAMQGRIPEELNVDRQRIFDLLDGRINVANPQNEVFRMLLAASCNHLNHLFPFLFEKINDYTELLLPDDLISELSIINDFVKGMSAEDCLHTEVIGWLYQFYISEKKDEVFAKKGKVQKDDIPAATQLFTPRWIVEYMVQNTVGKLWMQNNPSSSLKNKMPYYIETEASLSDDFIKINSPEEITLLDQACGSGHILVYGFELLYQIYEEAGYTASQIPQLIVEKNLWGYEIDERAAQLASFSVLMKARSYYRRLFRNKIEPNILCFVDLTLTDEEVNSAFKSLKYTPTDELKNDLKMIHQATNLGSLMQPYTSQEVLENLLNLIASNQNNQDLFLKNELDQLFVAVAQLHHLSIKYHCVVDNPPYMGGGNMNKELAEYVKNNYPDSKADLMTCFMESGLASLRENGLLGMINLPSWLFLSSFEKLREKIVKKYYINSLLHMGRGIFGIDWGSVAFIISKEIPNNIGYYYKLHKRNFQHIYSDDIKQIFLKAKTDGTIRINFDKYRDNEGVSSIEELIDKEGLKIAYTKNQKEFEKIPGSNIGYWLSERMISMFVYNKIGDIAISDGQNITGDNERYLRSFWEIDRNKCNPSSKWPLIAKGGLFRRWAGNVVEVVNWSDKAKLEYRNNPVSRIQRKELWFRKGITWNLVTSIGTGFRMLTENELFNKAAPTLLFEKYDEELIEYILGFLNTKIAYFLLQLLNPTLNTNIKEVLLLPLPSITPFEIKINVESCISISREEWNSRETSWDFLQNELIRLKGQNTEEAIELYKVYWSRKFFELHQNEEELNAQFIEIYGLQEELTPDVPLDEITILRDEVNQRGLKALAETYRSGWALVDGGQWIVDSNQSLSPNRSEAKIPIYRDHQLLTTNHQPPLPFDEKELVMQFISYAVGCMFGRYSLDKEGLILANQGEGVSHFLDKVEKQQDELSFVPDKDNIIPVLDNEWFADDIVAQFIDFIRIVWGDENVQQNIAYIEKRLGKTLRNYFYRDFYTDHVSRYKKRPIYWMISSPSGAFQALIYMHRYTENTISDVLNGYLRPYIEKLENRIEHLNHVAVEGTAREKTAAEKEIVKIEKVIDELRKYDREVLYPLATERISIDLDDGVLVNYNRFEDVLKRVAGLNDAAARKKVKGFDWVVF